MIRNCFQAVEECEEAYDLLQKAVVMEVIGRAHILSIFYKIETILMLLDDKLFVADFIFVSIVGWN